MEKIVEKTLLYDFYGELLTDRQKEIFQAVVFDDMSLSEAAEEFGISRQGIHDLVRRCEKSMTDYEDRLHMIERYEKIKGKVLTLLKTAGTEEEKALLSGILADLNS